MKKIMLSCLLVSSLLQAQFTFKGTINNYPNQRVIIKLNNAFDDLLVGNTTTDASGKFSIPIKEKYTGIIEVSLLDAKTSMFFISNNTSLDFSSNINPEGKLILDNPGNSINKTYQDFLGYDLKKNNLLPQLESIQPFYKSNETFYSPLKNEIQRISALPNPDLTPYPFLQYYIPTSDLVKSLDSTEPKDAASNQNLIIDHFKNAGEEFETSGLGKSLLFNYLKSSSIGASNQVDWEDRLDKSIQRLLDEIGEDTSRGQEVLSATINFLNSYGVTKLADKYMSKAESLTCEITPELKKTIEKNNSIKEGKAIPNFKFTHKIDGKYSSLYDIKTKYKLIIVWASWCNHCQQEMSSVKQFYDNFKKSGGEIIGLSVDYDKTSWQEFIKGTSWINDSDLLYWDSKFAKELNVSGTPTLFFVDQNNKILKITSKISDINNLIK